MELNQAGELRSAAGMTDKIWLSFLCRQNSVASCDRAAWGLTEEQ